MSERTLYTAIHRTSSLPSDPSTLSTAVRWIAKLGGFLGRKSDGVPGARVLWRGFQRLQDLTFMWNILHQ
ncbi:IS4 family transposase [Thermoflavimicrobium dichotomicum]|uniref:IS4 family transposase n=1 Tax=Thermoflavimicrobium dichotomicum TaxID=46223 RepID=UPI0024820C83|nr:IS4 family transposase [Thermoflavimicrobium dichotomicum]